MLADVSVIVICAVLVAAGLVCVVRWGAPAPVVRTPPLRYVASALVVGLAAGVVAAGAGGRLVMRLLALTSPAAQGQITENDAAIGEITAGGTLGLLVFAGVVAGLLSLLLYVVAGSLLPRGRAGGVVLGLVLLVLAGARIEPLREDNFDFNLVGPGWLSLLSFTALAVFQGMLTSALAARAGLRPLPLGGRRLLRAAAAVVVLVALPGFLGAVAEIA